MVTHLPHAGVLAVHADGAVVRSVHRAARGALIPEGTIDPW